MDFVSPLPSWLDEYGSFEHPVFEDRASEVVRTCLLSKKPEDFQKIMKISRDLAVKTAETYRLFDTDQAVRRPALFAYAGAVFQNLGADDLDQSIAYFAQDHLRILSALYGYLSPLDQIKPYRLDMKTLLDPPGASSLTDYWRRTVTDALVGDLRKMGAPFVLNLASNEFSRVLDTKRIPVPFISVHFKEERAGSLKTIGTYAKMARGNMVRQILKGQISEREKLKQLDILGYGFSHEKSSSDNWYYIRRP